MKRLSLVLILAECLIFSLDGHAWSWVDLWSTKDQQGQALMKQGKVNDAEKTFEDSSWRATAAYRMKHYQDAANAFQSLKNPDAYYNAGNALAQLKQYQQAINAYDKALSLDPNHHDAKYNREIIKRLLKQSKQDKNNKQQKKQENKDNSDQQTHQNPSANNDKNNQHASSQKKEDSNHTEKNNEKQKATPQEKQSENPESEKETVNQKPEAKSSRERESQQAKEQWLKLIPDDPGGLLREKFLRDHLRRENGWDQ